MNTLYQDDSGWYFWSETWTESYGPFASEGDARRALYLYATALDRVLTEEEGRELSALLSCENDATL